MVYNIDYHIIDKCNLNCASCNHFSSLVPAGSDTCKSIEQITADLTLLSKLKNEFHVISLLGGEPTLHPELSKILRITREILPNNVIHLVTNGTKYDKFERWKDALAENNVVVALTVYPYCNDYGLRTMELRKILEPEVEVEVNEWALEGFNYGFLSNRDNVSTDEEIRACYRRFQCNQLKNGKLYICHFAAQFNYLKDYFGDKVQFGLDGKEYLDLNGDVKAKDFYNFIYNSHPSICDHCVDAHNKGFSGPIHPWYVTKKEINEWLID